MFKGNNVVCLDHRQHTETKEKSIEPQLAALTLALHKTCLITAIKHKEQYLEVLKTHNKPILVSILAYLPMAVFFS